jgi:hypothetical protein
MPSPPAPQLSRSIDSIEFWWLSAEDGSDERSCTDMGAEGNCHYKYTTYGQNDEELFVSPILPTHKPECEIFGLSEAHWFKMEMSDARQNWNRPSAVLLPRSIKLAGENPTTLAEILAPFEAFIVPVCRILYEVVLHRVFIVLFLQGPA